MRTSIEFDRAVRDGTTEPSAYNKVGDHVIAYYFGERYKRTVVALKDLGKAPLDANSGTVVGNPRHHTLTIKTQKGATDTFEIAKDASVETSEGVVSGFKFDPENGAHVTVRYKQTGATKVARFVLAD